MALNRKSTPYPFEDLRWNERIVKIVHRGLAVVMATCAAVPIVMLINRLFPDWHGAYVVPIVFLVATEALSSHHRLRKVNVIEARWWFSRLAEILVILASLKLFIYALKGFDQLWVDIPLWRLNFYNVFFDRDFLLLTLIVIPVWVGCGEIDHLLNQIEVDEQLLAAEYDTGFSGERVEVRRSLANLIIVVGGLMVTAVAFLNFDSGSAKNGNEIVPLGMLSILIYFICGLILLSLTQFAILRTRWVINRINIDRKVTVRWVAYSLLLIIGLGFVVILLPTGYSGQLLLGLQIFLGFLLAFFQLILYLISLPFIVFFGWIMSLFNKPVQDLPQPPPIKLIPLQQATSDQTIPWFELLKSILFWVILLGLIGYAFYYYFREHPEFYRWVNRSQLWIRITGIWRKLAIWFIGVNRKIAGAVQGGLQRFRSPAVEDPDAFNKNANPLRMNPRHMAPRQQVIFYYLMLVHRAGERGFTRKASQTPLEFSDQLSLRLGPDNHPANEIPEQDWENSAVQADHGESIELEIERLTSGFMEARYSQHPITSNQAGRLRTYWQRILKLIRNTPKNR